MSKKKKEIELPEYAKDASPEVRAEMRRLAQVKQRDLDSERDLREEFGLTTRQAAFVVEYVIDRNPTAAAIRAGYKASSAKNAAYRALRNSGVMEAIAGLTSTWMEESRITREWVLAKLANNINEAEMAGKYSDVNAGLNLLMKHLNMFDEKPQEEEKTVQFFKMPDGQEVEF